MSTILDALRRLQRERSPHSLREEVLSEGAPPPRRRRRWPVALLLVLLVPIAGAGAWLVWLSVDALFFPTSPERIATPSRSATAPESQRPQVSRERLASARSSKPPDANPSPTTERGLGRTLPADPIGSSERAGTMIRIPEGEPGLATAAEGSGSADPEPSSSPLVAATPPSAAETAEREARLDTTFRLAPLESQPAPKESGLGFTEDPFPSGFPALSLQSVRWHPEPDRRQARILLDDTRPVDAQEGDIIAGVAVHRIDPGAVELRMGGRVQRIKVGK